MKLLYTDVRTPLTQVLTQEAVGLVEDGLRWIRFSGGIQALQTARHRQHRQ